ncbi:molybdopterin molybdotransferase MoeA [Pacificibacter marinus]|uniref:Molybdopterin molybdenumtransferase n=1 Tax=Pacificibacter marinus TaxID=658057 RepID=A0A1Y5RM93_9RHOB|nr:gephyrin-like molybdotransferase Glp [Pacificibacter marinus]SEK17713.1 molybdopterin molybdotransferase [Pacificibacter marinus]SLN19771.1 Molybdopterin molybdenumtransferase [Pacificibacter marinus]
MISVSQALDHVFSLCDPLGAETIPLRAGLGRVLAKDATATRNQPPFSASIMDGYAVRDADSQIGAQFTVIGEAAAGHRFDGTVQAGQAVRIFTGAPMPHGASRVVIQENVTRDGDTITQTDISRTTNIRDIGADFKAGDTVQAPRQLTPRDLALLAAMNIDKITVTRKPVVALIATGDELVMPGETPNDAQIIASNSFGLAAMVEAAGGIPRMLPIARDTESSLCQALSLAAGADMIVTIGGASVGDHDIVGKVAADMGLDRAFYKVAMRPGKPLMAGKLNGVMMLGLPGNPVSSLVTAHLFMLPALCKMLGLGAALTAHTLVELTQDLPANGPRAHYMRAQIDAGKVTPFASQDSALLRILSDANALIIRAPNAPASEAGDLVDVIRL